MWISQLANGVSTAAGFPIRIIRRIDATFTACIIRQSPTSSLNISNWSHSRQFNKVYSSHASCWGWNAFDDGCRLNLVDEVRPGDSLKITVAMKELSAPYNFCHTIPLSTSTAMGRAMPEVMIRETSSSSSTKGIPEQRLIKKQLALSSGLEHFWQRSPNTSQLVTHLLSTDMHT